MDLKENRIVIEYKQKVYRCNKPEKLESLRKALTKKLNLEDLNEIHLQYKEDENIFELQDDYDLQQVNENTPILVNHEKNNTTSVDNKLLSLFMDDSNKVPCTCLQYDDCKLCKGQKVIVLNEKLKKKLEKCFENTIIDNILSIRQQYFELGIKVENMDDFLYQHSQLQQKNDLYKLKQTYKCEGCNRISKNLTKKLNKILCVYCQDVQENINKIFQLKSSQRQSKNQNQIILQSSNITQSVLGSNNPTYSSKFSSTIQKKLYKPNEIIKFQIEINNPGETNWPSSVLFKCVEEVIKNSKSIKSLKPSEKKSYDIQFQAPSIPGSYKYGWRIFNEETKQYFGQRFNLQFEVEQDEEIKQGKSEFDQLEADKKIEEWTQQLSFLCQGKKSLIYEYTLNQLNQNPKLTYENFISQSVDKFERDNDIFN